MLKQGLVLEIIIWTDYYQKEKQKKSHWINDGWIKWKATAKFVGLRAKTYGYLINDISEDKKS